MRRIVALILMLSMSGLASGESPAVRAARIREQARQAQKREFAREVAISRAWNRRAAAYNAAVAQAEAAERMYPYVMAAFIAQSTPPDIYYSDHCCHCDHYCW
jgi:hypothetical protein